MAIEVNPNYPSDLDSSLPTNSDLKAEGDDNFRNLKRVLKTTWPNVNGAINASDEEHNFLVGVTSLVQTQLNALATSTTTATGATLWVSGTTYALGAFVYSPLNARNYRKITASSVSVTDPSLDATNWTDPSGVTGTAAGTLDLLTGANIASAATVNLNTATGNRVHITGTTTITAVTLTRGPRTVIFDGILTLTHHATNNNLPGGANITTAAGDVAIYESDGTTVRCIAYTKASGLSVIAPVAGLSLIATLTPTAAANVDALTTFSSTYDNYLIVGTGILPAVSDTLRIRVANAGVVDTGSNYATVNQESASSNTLATTSGQVAPGGVQSAVGGVSFIMEVLNVNDAVGLKAIVGRAAAQNTASFSFILCGTLVAYSSAASISGVRLFWNAGNNFAAGGTIRIYGYSKT